MKMITIDFRGKCPEVTSRYSGEIGEHQATTLRVIPAEEMQEDERISFYYVVFEVEGGLASTRTYTNEENIDIELWEQVTRNQTQRLQLIGTNSEQTVISKSPVVALFLGESLEGLVVDPSGDHDSLVAEVGDHEERITALEEGGVGGAQADWSEDDPEDPSYIKNKPDVYTKAQTDTAIAASAVLDLADANSFAAYTPAEVNALQLQRRIFKYRQNPVVSVHVKYQYGEAQAVNFLTMSGNDTTSPKWVEMYTFDTKGGQITMTARWQISENNFSDELLAKLIGIAEGAEVNVQPDWNQSDTGADDYIKNKPTIEPVKYTELWDSTKSEMICTIAEALTMFEAGKPLYYKGNLVVNIAHGNDYYFIWYFDLYKTTQGLARRLWLTQAAFALSTDKTPNNETTIAKALTTGEYAKINDGSVVSGNTSFVTGGQVYDAIQQGGGGADVPLSVVNGEINITYEEA